MGSKKHKSASEWQALMAEQRASGLSVSAFCLQHGLVAKTFYNQRKKLSRASGSTARAKPGFVKVQPSPSPLAASSGCLALQYRHSRLELASSVDPAWLAKLMGSLP